jgi:hypothetical protein
MSKKENNMKKKDEIEITDKTALRMIELYPDTKEKYKEALCKYGDNLEVLSFIGGNFSVRRARYHQMVHLFWANENDFFGRPASFVNGKYELTKQS